MHAKVKNSLVWLIGCVQCVTGDSEKYIFFLIHSFVIYSFFVEKELNKKNINLERLYNHAML